MNVVRTLVLVVVLLAITLTLLLAGATGLGVLLHRLLPGVELGTGVLIGVFALSVSVNFVLSLLDRANFVREELEEMEVEEIVEAIHRPARRHRSRR